MFRKFSAGMHFVPYWVENAFWVNWWRFLQGWVYIAPPLGFGNNQILRQDDNMGKTSWIMLLEI